MSQYLKTVYDTEIRPLTTYPSQLTKHLFQKFAMKSGQKILEAACGRGDFINCFRELGLDCYALDKSDEFQENILNIHLKKCNFESDQFPFRDNYFDIIYSKSLLEHLYDPENFFKEAVRVLKPGGLMLTLVPDWESNYKIYFDDHTHKTPYTSVALHDIYKMFSLRGIKVQKFRQLPIVWKYKQLNLLCSVIAPFVPVRTNVKFLRWSRELMLLASAYK
ncbi:MAG: class I SAM-dependent methyltransferase [Oligoflexia bacterium]|nr:class I SAM-dependent methyltransferase [Oligoflexia bacterium]